MAKYSVGCGLAGVYAGILKPNGYEWKDKTDVTIEATYAVAQYLLFNDAHVGFSYDGEKYTMRVIKEE